MNDTQHNDTAKDELLPCPSCGGPATKGIGSHATVDHPILWVVECNKRCLSTIYRMDAVEVWNKRAAFAELERLRAMADNDWCSLEEWPRNENEFSGAYWSGIALLEPTKDSMELDAHVDFVLYDAGVAIWWGTVSDSNGDNDIDPARIIALYYYPRHPSRFDARIEAAKKRLREEFPKRWWGEGNPYGEGPKKSL